MKKIYFIGIGGIGVSALARFYLKRGDKVFGSDLVNSEITEKLKKEGAKIYIGPQNGKYLFSNFDLVIYSPAIFKEHLELKKAKKLSLKTLSYPQALGQIIKNYFSIAVAGTHGKSTTTALVSLILIKAGFDPNVIIGTKLKEFGDSNCRVGNSNYFVFEADEWKASFLNYFPKIIVLTNIEKEHLDYYQNLNEILRTFKNFVNHLPKDGWLIVNRDDKNLKKFIKIFKKKTNVLSFSLKQKEAKVLKKILKIPGDFNVSNALAALTLARILKISDNLSFKALSEYRGIWRRFQEEKIEVFDKKIILINDYAHHPTEIKVTLKAVRKKYSSKKIYCVFQPHQYQRTYFLFDDFVKILSKAPIDVLILTKIYEVKGRENLKIRRKISSEKLIEEIKHQKEKNLKEIRYFSNFKKIAEFLEKKIKDDDVLIIMGAGDIYQFNFYLKLLKKAPVV
ncbi:UDP-N-acetylmuramate--L-alanine ligase [bacterium]|nr:UDP-N-acetylmuramate--L-alanine ligase [bacterium]